MLDLSALTYLDWMRAGAYYSLFPYYMKLITQKYILAHKHLYYTYMSVHIMYVHKNLLVLLCLVYLIILKMCPLRAIP